jgi:stage II sporulation protein D
LSQKLHNLLPQDARGHRRITDIKIVDRDSSGYVKKMGFYVNHAWFTVPTAKVVAIIPQFRSSTFSLSKSRHNVTFKGSGFGHQLGFCQWGAYDLARQGWDYRKILKFYYPGTTIMKFEDVKPEPEVQSKSEPQLLENKEA